MPIHSPFRQVRRNHADLVYLHLLELKSCLANPAAGTTPPSDSLLRQSSARERQGAPRAVNSTRKLWGLRLGRPANRAQNARKEYPGASPRADYGNRAERVNTAAVVQVADEPLITAVPGSLSNDQLGVLLGIALEAGFDIQGFVDSAVLMASASALPARSWFLDVYLTRACLTELRAGDEVAQLDVQELPGCGLMSCMDGWANLLADRFVQDTRFDPLHAADTEQQLYDQLYDWVERTRSTALESDFAAEIRHGGHERRVQVPVAVLRKKLMQRFEQVAQKLPVGARLLVAPRSAALPGLMPGLAEFGIDAQRLPEDALERGFARHASAISSGELTLVNRLPCGGLEEEPAPEERPNATHVLFEGRAWPLHGNRFGLPDAGRAGDTIGKDGRSFQLISVEPGS